jgi:hypothetical protein
MALETHLPESLASLGYSAQLFYELTKAAIWSLVENTKRKPRRTLFLKAKALLTGKKNYNLGKSALFSHNKAPTFRK